MLAPLLGSLVEGKISALILIPILTISLSVEVCGKSAPVGLDTNEDLEAPVEAADTEADAGAEAGAQAEAPPVPAASCGSSPGPRGASPSTP